jgi:lipoprotein-anchoring transpeptidase ErfK/SrfK
MVRVAICLIGLVAFIGESRAAPAIGYNEPGSGVPTRFAAMPASLGRPIARAIPDRFTRQEVDYGERQPVGTIVIDTNEKYLYLITGPTRALRYGIGVGRPGFEWAGVKTISRKAEWPNWTPPPEMLKRRPDLPRYMPGGPDNPLGARALYLGSSLYRIHGTNEPETIGTNVSSGCIRMMNEDVTDLYNRVAVGTKVIVR